MPSPALMRSLGRRLLAAAPLAAALALPALALAHDDKVGTLAIASPWARATPPGATVGAGYLAIENRGAQAERLVGATSPVAGQVELHAMTVENGVMRMRPLADGLELVPGGRIEIKPGGYHLMFVDLKQPLREGEHVPLTLEFRKGGNIDVELVVERVGASAPTSRGRQAGPEGDPTR